MLITIIEAIVNGHSYQIECVGGVLDKSKVLEQTKNTTIPAEEWQWQDESGNIISDGICFGWSQPSPSKRFFLSLKPGVGA